ncbi:MAG: hypothetical protein F4Y58_01165 [Gammaproteobacteria bacterium]|nr:hypothetical protein [Gammaproteobacteria bacterium]
MSNGKTLSFDVPPAWIMDDTVSEVELQLEIAVTEMREGGETTTQTTSVVVTKVNNGPSETSPRIDRNGNTLTLVSSTLDNAIAVDPDGDNTINSNPLYQWQWCQSSCSLSDSWDDINLNADGESYDIPSIISNISTIAEHRFRIKISYTDGQGYTDNTIFTNNLPKDPSANIKVRAKVFLEGPLQ